MPQSPQDVARPLRVETLKPTTPNVRTQHPKIQTARKARRWYGSVLAPNQGRPAYVQVGPLLSHLSEDVKLNE